MKWRVIVRMGLANDASSIVRNTFETKFKGCGFLNTKTGTWESPAIDPNCAARTISDVLRELAALANNFQSDSPCMSHFWVYLDKVEE